MTNRELVDSAWSELMQSNISGVEWQNRVKNGYKGKPYDYKNTSYGRTKALLDQVVNTVITPTPTPKPTPKLVQSADGTLTWDPTDTAVQYIIAEVPPTGSTLYEAFGAGTRMFKPTPRMGTTMQYDVAAKLPDGSQVWYGRVTYTWPGVIIPPVPTSGQTIGIDVGGWDLFSQLHSAGIGWFRTNSSGLNNISKAVSVGMKLQSVVVGEGGTLGSIDPVKYANDLRALALKYGPARYEICNEPEGNWFWTDANTQSGANALAKIVKACRAATGDIVGVKLCVSLQDYNGWQDRILAYINFDDYDEGIIHPYGGSTKSSASALGNRDSVIKAHQRSGKKIAITEVGWPTAVGQPSTGDSAQWTETEQVANIASFCKWVRDNPQMISMMTYFNAHDYGSNMWYGVIGNNGAKPSLAELAKWGDD